MGARLVLCSKSPWEPAARREHALAELAAAHGHEVVFVERARDVRTLRPRTAAAWLAELRGSEAAATLPGVRLVRRTVPAPGHRGGVAQAAETLLLATALRRVGTAGAVVVATAPWHWPAVARVPAARRAFDCADDWSRLLPRRRDAIAALHRRIAVEADAIVVAAAPLAALFAPAAPVEVRNGTHASLLARPLADRPADGRPSMAYAGTLSERVDTRLLAAALEALPGWRLDLYGECRYAGRDGRPAPELAELLARFPERAAWHGPVARTGLAARLDAAAVLVLPHRPLGAVTGDAMKLYDYAARGRPIVSTRWAPGLAAGGPPYLTLADGDAFAAAVAAAASEPAGRAREQRAWAEEQSWERRWPAWEQAVLGS